MHTVGQENLQAELEGGLGHTGRSISCISLVCPAASAVMLLKTTEPCLPETAVAALISLLPRDF